MEANLQILRDSTKWFIEQDPTMLVLTPKSGSGASRGPGGGFIKAAGTPRQAQLLKLIWQGGEGSSSGEGGKTSIYDYVIVGLHDALIEVGDTFKIGTNLFVVESMAPDNGYEKKAFAVSHGKNPSDG